MPVVDPQHISEGKICTIDFQDGSRLIVYVLNNDPQAQELHVDLGGDDGNYASIPYAKIKAASVWINVQEVKA